VYKVGIHRTYVIIVRMYVCMYVCVCVCVCVCIYIYIYIYIYTHRVSQEECARLRESVPYVKVC